MLFPSPAQSYAQRPLDFNKILIQHPHITLFMYAEGYSMINAYIPPKALLVVDKVATANNGDIVLAEVNGEFTVRRLKKNEHTCWLCPANNKYPELKITPQMNMTICGVVIRIITNPMDIEHV